MKTKKSTHNYEVTMTDPFLEWLKLELKEAMTEVERYKKRNAAGEEGESISDYCDEDWTGWFQAQGRFDAIESVLTKYTDTPRRT